MTDVYDSGELVIDRTTGTITYMTSGGFMVLRITHLKLPIPEHACVDLTALPALTSYTPLVTEEPHIDAMQIPDPVTQRCKVCGKRHDTTDNIRDGDFLFIIGHEYELVTTTSLTGRGYPRGYRMGFCGRAMQGNGRLLFSGRGPDRSHSGEYAGDVVINGSTIMEAWEVSRIEAKRYVGRVLRDRPKL